MLASALLAAIAAGLWWPHEATARVRRLQLTGSPRHGSGTTADRHRQPRWWMSPWMSSLVAAFAVDTVVPGVAGHAAAVLVAILVLVLLRATTSAADVRRREQVQRDLPLAVDLLVSCVDAGRPPGQSLVAVAASVRGPLGDDLRGLAGRLELGADPAAVWQDLARDEMFAPLGRSLARSARTGSSISLALAHCADDLRRDRRAAADTNARKVGVRVSAPLGACFLPAFFLVGILPTIIGSVRSLSW